MPKGKGYALSAQHMAYGPKTGGGSEIHNRMKNKILTGKQPGDSAYSAYNKNMYKSETGLMSNGKSSKGKMSY